MTQNQIAKALRVPLAARCRRDPAWLGGTLLSRPVIIPGQSRAAAAGCWLASQRGFDCVLNRPEEHPALARIV